MSLVAARGPLGPDPAGRFSAPLPAGLVYVEPHPRRVQAIRDGRIVIDTERALLVHRRNRPLYFAFPADDVGDLPHTPEPEAPGFVRVPWDALDTWIEEGRRLVHYLPNPYHRVDCRPTRRRLRVDVAGTTLVDTDDTVIVFETALEPRLYVPRRWSALICCGRPPRRPTATTRARRCTGRWLSAIAPLTTWPGVTRIRRRKPADQGIPQL